MPLNRELPDIFLLGVSTFLSCEWLLFPFLFLSLTCTITSWTIFNPANLLLVHLFPIFRKIPILSKGPELFDLDCFYNQSVEWDRGTKGRVALSQQCWHDCPCTACDKNTMGREMGWFSLHGCRMGNVPISLAQHNILGQCPGWLLLQYPSRSSPDVNRSPSSCLLCGWTRPGCNTKVSKAFQSI